MSQPVPVNLTAARNNEGTQNALTSSAFGRSRSANTGSANLCPQPKLVPSELPNSRQASIFKTSKPAQQVLVGSAFIDAKLIRPLNALNRGGTIAIQLSGGEEVIGNVQIAQEDPSGWVHVGGGLMGNENGTFFLSGFDQQLSGKILLPSRGIAYNIVGQNSTQFQIQEISISKLMCHNMPPPTNRILNARASVASMVVPILNSRPLYAKVLYLDFDGETVTDPAWNEGRTIVARESGLTSAQIIEVWNHVKEDFWPFGVNVTTEISKYNAASPGTRMRCVVTPTDTAAPGKGGVAHDNTFQLANGTQFLTTHPCWVFVSNPPQPPQNIGVAISHEFGHTLGLTAC